MAPKQKQEPGRGIWIGNGKGGTHPADAARTPQPPLTPHQQAGPSISTKSRCYDPLCIQICRMKAGLTKAPSEAGDPAVGLCSVAQADLSHGELDGTLPSTRVSHT